MSEIQPDENLVHVEVMTHTTIYYADDFLSKYPEHFSHGQ